MAKKIIAMNNEEFYMLIAPDGEVQPAVMGETIPDCLGFIKLMHHSRIGQSWHELKMKGFTIEKVKVTITANNTSKNG